MNKRSDTKKKRDGEFVIVPFVLDDLDQIDEIETLTFPEPWKRSDFVDLNKYNEFVILVAKDGIEVVGYAVYQKLPEEFELHNIAVKSDYRKHGVASALIENMLSDADSMKVCEVYLQVRESNLAAKRLYEKFGFQIVGFRPKYFSDNKEDALVMKRSKGI
ncbi:MAG: ribosomal protein S18-alanine N-acetyltransferase [Pseudomonadota bacterium]